MRYEDIVLRIKKLKLYKANFKNVKTYWGNKNQWKIMLKEVRPDVVYIQIGETMLQWQFNL